MITLADHQRAAIAAVLTQYQFVGVTRQVVQMATGAGKTITAAALASALFQGEEPLFRGRCLFLAHRDTLLKQAFEAFAQYFPVSQLGIVQAENNYVATKCIFASVQTLEQPHRLRELLRYGKFDLVICDECHHAAAPSYRRLIGTMKNPVGPVMTPEALLIGLTATPRRSDGLSLRLIFEQVSYSVGILELITAEPEPWLVDLKAITVEIPDLHLSGLVAEDEEEDFTQEELARAVEASIKSRSRYTAALEVLRRYPEVGQLQGVYFGSSVADAYGFADMANAAGIVTEVVTGKTKDDEKQAIYDRFRTGATQYISNMNVLPEGTDLPCAKVAIIGYHTRFIGRYIQMVGRITRIHPEDRGKPSAQWKYPTGYVIDLTDNEHTVVMLPDMVGTTEEQVKGRSVKQLVKDKVVEARPVIRTPVYRPGERIRIAGASVFTNRPWKRRGEDYQLVTPHGTYLARKTLGGETYETFLYPKQGDVKRIKKALPLEPALGFADAHLQQIEQRHQARTDHAYRSQRATPAEVAALARVLRPFTNRTLTKGQVRDAWDQLKAAGSVSNWHAQYGPKRAKKK